MRPQRSSCTAVHSKDMSRAGECRSAAAVTRTAAQTTLPLPPYLPSSLLCVHFLRFLIFSLLYIAFYWNYTQNITNFTSKHVKKRDGSSLFILQLPLPPRCVSYAKSAVLGSVALEQLASFWYILWQRWFYLCSVVEIQFSHSNEAWNMFKKRFLSINSYSFNFFARFLLQLLDAKI